MKTKVRRDRDDTRAEERTQITIETAEDCQLAEDRRHALMESPEADAQDEELRSLEDALRKWHATRRA